MDENKGIINKEFINKILVLGTITITVVVIASISGIVVARSYNDKLAEKYYSYIEKNKKYEASEEEKVEEQNISIPVYSDNAKNRMKEIYLSTNGEKVAYLTFDDGPSSNITPQILQILQNEGVKATFFVLGSRVELYPELVRQAYEAGHYIANHGYSHDYSRIYSSPNSVLDEYNLTEKLIKATIENEEYSSYLFRFPGGSENGKYARCKK